MRTIDDTEQMMNIAKTKKKAIVIGGGLLGLECARGLLDQGMEVTVLHLAEWLMEMQLDRKAGNMLKADLEKQGMKLKMQANTTEILGEDDVEGVKLADGREIGRLSCYGSRYTTIHRSGPKMGLDVDGGIVCRMM